MEVMKGNDVFVNAPTGLGKSFVVLQSCHTPLMLTCGSVCFQVPAIAIEHGITLVITPLIGQCASSCRA